MRAALAAKTRDGKLLVLDQITLEAPKTKLLAGLLAELQVESALIVIPARDTTLERAARNLPRVKVLRAEGANVYDLLRYDRLIVTPEGAQALVGRLS